MRYLHKFFAVIITILSLFIVIMVLMTNETTSTYFNFFTDLFASTEEVLASENGNFEPLSGSGDLISDSQKESLEDSDIDGSGYSFDTTFYPYYGMLNESEQNVYSQVYANAVEKSSSFVPVSEISVSELVDVMEAVYSDHPELFYLSTKYGYIYTSDKTVAQITLSFNSLADNIAASKNSFNSAALLIINEAQDFSSDYEKEKYVHDAIAELTTYDENASLSQSAYSALVSGTSVCAGYSRAFQYIMTQLGIPTYFVSGTATGNHAWNIVCLDGEYYNVDLTWDDQESGVIYNYFNLSDTDFSSTHTRTNLALNLPSCNGTKYSGLESTVSGKANEEPHEANSASAENDKSLSEVTESLPSDIPSNNNINTESTPDNTQQYPDNIPEKSGKIQGGPGNTQQFPENKQNQSFGNIGGR